MPTKSIVQPLRHPLFEKHNIEVLIKRDDLIHPVISGNKWRKLKYNIAFAKEHNKTGIISFGGSYSNHIHALAFACQQEGLNSIGIIRGEREYAKNTTLSQAKHWGMELKFVDRQTYRQKNHDDYLLSLQHQYPNHVIVPEGGSNQLALPGVSEICKELSNQCEFDTLITPVGSAGTISGLIIGDNNQHQILGIAVIKQADYLKEEINSLMSTNHKSTNWQLLTQYHGGGYAKFSDKDLAELKDFIGITQVPFEPIYSGKMILALLKLVKSNYFPRGHRVVLLHTGGLQGLHGLVQQQRIKASEWPLPLERPVR